MHTGRSAYLFKISNEAASNACVLDLHCVVVPMFQFTSNRCLTKNSTAVIELEIARPVCMELYQDCRELGRFMLRSGGGTIAAGVVTKVSMYLLCGFQCSLHWYI